MHKAKEKGKGKGKKKKKKKKKKKGNEIILDTIIIWEDFVEGVQLYLNSIMPCSSKSEEHCLTEDEEYCSY
jgi:hypothetical protein